MTPPTGAVTVTGAQAQVPDQIDCLAKELETLHTSIDTLTSRLAGVLKQPKTPEEAADKESQELVALANTIRSSVFSVKNARINIRDILDRLEL